ncbi:hypothetical protein D9M69_512370 [compost metagenome]
MATRSPPRSSMRLKYEPQRLVSAIGTTGGSMPSARAPSRIFITPPLKGCSSPSRVIAPSGKMPSRSPSRSTPMALAKAASYAAGSSFCGAMGMALASLNSQPSTGTLKMRWSMMKRMGRGLAAISSTASMKLTWLHTSTAAPSVGMCWSSLMSKR